MRARILDPGAIFAGWVGLGMALVLAIAFELIIPVQTIVFLLAAPMGVLIGVYANVRSERWRPRGRVFANGLYAGAVTGLALAVLYVLLRFVFVYGDSGALPDGTFLACRMGPDCTFARYVDAGQADELAQLGITDAASFEAATWRELMATGGGLFVLTVAGSLVGATARAFSSQKLASAPQSAPLRSSS